jgi:hypothetical protein
VKQPLVQDLRYFNDENRRRVNALAIKDETLQLKHNTLEKKRTSQAERNEIKARKVQ